jgi:hypothetical protein
MFKWRLNPNPTSGDTEGRLAQIGGVDQAKTKVVVQEEILYRAPLPENDDVPKPDTYLGHVVSLIARIFASRGSYK